ncbi:MAG: hypothetical protein KatS3mg095_0128 [Candidatus Parcubacteria bacterium]|nr:MAG: hypothetical protein KatS3mg095_0128 [Candidatus Parcubacteria bacterium]
MTKRGQLESLLSSIIIILLILSAIAYYLQFRLGYIPVFKPQKSIKPAEKGIVPEGTFFENQKDKLPFLFIKKSYAKAQIKYKNNKNLETYIVSPPKLIFLEDNILDLVVSGKNKANSLEKIYFQYKIIPIDKDWQKLYSQQKRIILPKGFGFYKIYVRSINKNNEIDPTPDITYVYTLISKNYKDVDIQINSQRTIITLTNKSKNSIKITNWKILSQKVNILIPKAVRDVNPKLENNSEDIILEPKERLIIYPLYATTSTFIPLNFKYPYPKNSPLGFNFKINKCFIFLSQLRFELKDYIKQYSFPCNKFTKKELLNLKLNYKLTNNCLNILEKISCSGPKLTDWEKIGQDSLCYRFFEQNYTYSGCYKNKKNDKDFYFKDWLVFVPIYEKFANDKYDEIKVYDENNLLVNKKFIY